MMIQNVQDDKRVVYNSLGIVLSFNIESIPELYNTVWISHFRIQIFFNFRVRISRRTLTLRVLAQKKKSRVDCGWRVCIYI